MTGQLDFDRQVYAACTRNREPTVERIAEQLSVPPNRVAAAVSRLACRDLLVA